ncbi:hypothetical protein R8Z50_33260 [Longispora sp. K20-0274]|uniref:hypothetical protein n=1 Tax=Longispora sp. K20-0274 TaxID=3088255 RepID=UPI00399ADAFE
MMRRVRSGAAALGGVFVGALEAGPAWAAGLEEARRGRGIVSSFGLICCLVVVGLIALGAVIGISATRKRRR